MRRVVSAGAVVALLVASGAIARYDGPPPGPAAEHSRPDAFAGQELEWTPCGDDECAQLVVPVDYDDPAGETLEIAVERASATGERLGSLVVNPGGPGAPGTGLAAAPYVFSSEVRERYDIVGFDPRGVGASSPINCMIDDQLPYRLDNGRLGPFWKGCEQRTGAVLDHASTVEVARDLEVLRSALRQERLSYLGFSYGTQIGATYAALFPERVGRMVLDGAVDPDRRRMEETLDLATALQSAFESFLSDCLASSCPIAPTALRGEAAVGRMLDHLWRHPLRAGREGALDIYGAFDALVIGLGEPARWPTLERALSGAIHERDGAGLARLGAVADVMGSTSPSYGVSVEPFMVIGCLDDPWAADWSSAFNYLPVLRRASPALGIAFLPQLTLCNGFSLRPVPGPTSFAARGAPPILVMGSTGDLHTPHVWAAALAAQLESGVLVTRDGPGHTSYGSGNQCIDDLVDAYLIDGTTPEDGTVC